MKWYVKEEWLKKVCERLLEYDPNVVEIVQFGSSVYAPEYARDVDILVLTREAKEYEGYLDVAHIEGAPFNVDVVVVELGRKLREEFARGVLGAFKVLYGSGEHVFGYVKALGDPTFDEAKAALKAAREYMELAIRASDALLRDRHIRQAFDSLFHAARIASMTYLSTEISRWGSIRKMLPEPYRSKFKDFISTLHVEYFYHGNYPKDKVKEEFDLWCRRVEEFIDGLESETIKKTRKLER
ncbi:MAG: nucleotidyltransferase domain-containing protein [Thermoproteota archaeon]